ncbi:MAG: tetratricopeptide repeat protein [Acidobacteria bacterium]|nr:tetratricopeptide repeat protein [Acidobacteriota bacterium]
MHSGKSKVFIKIATLLLCGWVFLSASPHVAAQGVDLQAKSRQGAELMRTRRFAEAIPIYREMVKALPDNPGLIMNLGLSLHFTERFRESIPQFEKVLKLDPKQDAAWFFLGTSHFRLGEAARAVEPLRKAVRAQSDNIEAREMLADTLLGLERFEQAEGQFKKLTELEPQNAAAWYGLGLCYEGLAAHSFAKIEELAPESGYLFALLAASRSERQRSSSYFFYRKALEQMPNLHGVHTAVAEIYRATGHEDWAAAEEEKERRLPPPDCAVGKLECDFWAGRFQELLEAAPKQGRTAETHYWLSRAYGRLAYESFNRLEELPDSAQRHARSARINRNQGRHLESAREWREALKLQPGNSRFQEELVRSLRQGRDYKSAQPLLEDLIKRQPESAHMNFLMGDTLLNLQQAEEAIPYLNKASHDPMQLVARASLGRAYILTNQAEEAISHLKAALSLDRDGNLHFQLARAYQRTNQRDLAREMLAEYQKIRKSQTEQRRAAEEAVQITAP